MFRNQLELLGSDSIETDNSDTSDDISVPQLAVSLGVLCSLDICVVLGNFLALFCLAIDRYLRQNRTNYFVGSLALADLLLGLFVLPPAIATQVNGQWPFGALACRIWLSLDVWLYSASIYNLIAVAFDRFSAITRPLKHKALITHARAIYMIVWAWTVSFLIALPSLFLDVATVSENKCLVIYHSGIYVLYSTVGSFYLPTAVLLYLYVKIYRTIRRVKTNGTQGIVRKMDSSSFVQSVSSGSKSNGKSKEIDQITIVSRLTDRQVSVGRGLRIHRGGYHKPLENGGDPKGSSISSSRLSDSPPSPLPKSKVAPAKEVVGQFLAKKQMVARNCRKKLLSEFKAIRMIAMVTTCYFVSWAGFCILCTVNVFAHGSTDSNSTNLANGSSTVTPSWLIDWVVWLSYANSAVDPLIYAVTNQRFRRTFRRILRLEYAWCLLSCVCFAAF